MIPGILKAWRGVNEVLTTLLLNYIILQFFEWSIRIDKYTPGVATAFINLFGVKDPTQPYPQAADVPANAKLPTLTDTLQSGPLPSLFTGQAWYDSIIGTAAFGRITHRHHARDSGSDLHLRPALQDDDGLPGAGGGGQPGGGPADGYPHRADHHCDLLY